MGVVQFPPDNIKTFYGLNQIAQEIEPSDNIPTQIIGLVPVGRDGIFLDNYCVPVRADLSDSSSYRNDNSYFLFRSVDTSTPVVFVLQKLISGVWTDIQSPITSGVNFPFGSFPAYPDRTGQTIDWNGVLTTNGTGFYRLKLDALNPADEQFSLSFILKEFSQSEGTARITSKFEFGRIGRVFESGTWDLINMSWVDQLRFEGMFYKVDPQQEITNIRYSDRSERLHKIISKEAFQIDVNNIQLEVYERLNKYGLSSNFVYADDYNTKHNKRRYDNFRIRKGDSANIPIDTSTLVINASISCFEWFDKEFERV